MRREGERMGKRGIDGWRRKLRGGGSGRVENEGLENGELKD